MAKIVRQNAEESLPDSTKFVEDGIQKENGHPDILLDSLPSPSKPHSHFRRSHSMLVHSKHPQRPRHRFLSATGTKHALTHLRLVSQCTFNAVGVEDENQERGNWDSSLEFFLSCLGYAVGLGNIWRFPYLCYRSGGGAFLIPYFTMLFLCGLPMMLMELSLGQYSSEGPLTVWKLCPIFKGIGIGMIVCTTMCAIYYNIINGWALYYFVISIREHLPWSCCSELWADQKCVTLSKNCFPTNVSYSTTDDVEFSADQYFHRVVLGIVEEFGIIGNVQLHLLVALFVAWIIVFAALMKGIKSIGKTVYFTATFPYFVLVVLLSRSLCEEGALDGIIFFLTPKFEMLLKAQVWGDAAAQIFYSTGVCFGGVITLASYNRFNNNLYRDAMIVTFGNSITSILSGFTVFSILGFMARSLNTTVDEVATAGPGLTFIVYPQAVTLLRWSPLWSALFFLMLIVLTLSSMFPMVESVATAFIDQFPKSLRPYQFWVALLCCVFMFLLGIPLTTGGGMYILQLLDTYGVGYALLVLGLVEVVTVAWLYKAENLCKNIKEMTGKEPFKIIYYLWTFITPTVLVLSIIFQLWDWKPLVYGDHMFPPLAGRIGIVLAVIPLSPIPVYIIYCLIRKVAPNEKIIDALKRMSKGCFEPFLLEHKISKVVADDNVFQ